MASLADQFAIMAKNVIGRKTTEAILEKLSLVAYDMVERYVNVKDYHDVTGNLLNSFAVGVYHKGKINRIVDATDIGLEPPTRLSLAKGELYDLTYYYSGKPARHLTEDGKKLTRPYRGEYGSGGKDGVSVAHRSLIQMHPSGTYAIVAVVAMEYAKFVQNKRNHDVLTGLRDELPGIFEGKIVTI